MLFLYLAFFAKIPLMLFCGSGVSQVESVRGVLGFQKGIFLEILLQERKLETSLVTLAYEVHSKQ